MGNFIKANTTPHTFGILPKKNNPTKGVKGFFWEHMDFYHMKDEVMKAWEIISERESDEAEAVSGEG